MQHNVRFNVLLAVMMQSQESYDYAVQLAT